MRQEINIGNIPGYMKDILPYLSVTFEYVLLSLFFGLVFAFVLAAMKLSRFRILRGIAYAYTTVMRCIPALVMLFVVYFTLPIFSREVLSISMYDTPPIVFVVVAFSLLLAGYLSEVLRAAYQSVSKDQFDAALSIGLTPWQAIIRIIVPQAFYYSLPNLANSLIFLIKDGALAYSIGLIDVMGRATQINTMSYNQHSLEIFIALALIYWPLALILEKLFKILEEKFKLQKDDKNTKKPWLQKGQKGFLGKFLNLLPFGSGATRSIESTEGGAKK